MTTSNTAYRRTAQADSSTQCKAWHRQYDRPIRGSLLPGWFALAITALLAIGGTCACPVAAGAEQERPPDTALIVVVGAPGTEEYGQEFQEASKRWLELGARQGWATSRIDAPAPSDPTCKEQLRKSIAQFAEARTLWLVLLGHGTYSGEQAKFNLVGPDVSSSELAEWLGPVSGQVIAVNCFSSSASFLLSLSSRDRVVVSATRSSGEYNYSRFGRYLAQSIDDLSVDLDHDQSVSLLEAFLAASNRTTRFYMEEARLATEHALLDDNGDKVGTSAEFYRGVLPVKQAQQGELDGRQASRIILSRSAESVPFSTELAEARAVLEGQLDALRKLKPQLPEEEYYQRLEQLLLELTELYDRAEAEAAAAESTDATSDLGV